MTHVLEVVGPAPIVVSGRAAVASGDTYSAHAWGSREPIWTKPVVEYSTTTEIQFDPVNVVTVTLVDGVDIGELAEPGLYDYWFDRYFLAYADPGVRTRLPGSSELWPRRDDGLDIAVLHDVELERKVLKEDGLTKDEIEYWTGLLKARKSEPDVTDYSSVFTNNPGSLVVLPDSTIYSSTGNGSGKFIWGPRPAQVAARSIVVDRRLPLSAEQVEWELNNDPAGPMLHAIAGWYIVHDEAGSPYVIPQREEDLAKQWASNIQESAAVQAFWIDRKQYILQSQRQWLDQIAARLPQRGTTSLERGAALMASRYDLQKQLMDEKTQTRRKKRWWQ